MEGTVVAFWACEDFLSATFGRRGLISLAVRRDSANGASATRFCTAPAAVETLWRFRQRGRLARSRGRGCTSVRAILAVSERSTMDLSRPLSEWGPRVSGATPGSPLAHKLATARASPWMHKLALHADSSSCRISRETDERHHHDGADYAVLASCRRRSGGGHNRRSDPRATPGSRVGVD